MYQKIQTHKNIIVVGGTYRNLGKTEFICSLLKRFNEKDIVVMKIKTRYPGDGKFHGRGKRLESGYLIRREDSTEGMEDSKRLLDAGASSVLYIRSRAEKLGEAMEEALAATKKQLIICESNSVVDVLSPAAYIMIIGPDRERYKPSSTRLMDKADIIIKSSGMSFDINPEDLNISAEGGKWIIRG